MTPNRREERGIVLPLVLIIGLLLSASVVPFVHRSVVDKLVVVNRDRGAAAAALARGGIQIALAVLFEDRLQKIVQQKDIFISLRFSRKFVLSLTFNMFIKSKSEFVNALRHK